MKHRRDVTKARKGHEQMEKVNLAGKLAQISEYWSPRIVAELNGQRVKLAKFKGEFDWHFHEAEDELFLVVKGQLAIHLRNDVVDLSEGEFLVVPRGVEHKPVAVEEVHALLFEPVTTLNTGNVRNERTIDRPDWL
jgi:mannose-6-phosphate isomerase-like protein (cupin superfamily)